MREFIISSENVERSIQVLDGILFNQTSPRALILQVVDAETWIDVTAEWAVAPFIRVVIPPEVSRGDLQMVLGRLQYHVRRTYNQDRYDRARAAGTVGE